VRPRDFFFFQLALTDVLSADYSDALRATGARRAVVRIEFKHACIDSRRASIGQNLLAPHGGDRIQGAPNQATKSKGE